MVEGRPQRCPSPDPQDLCVSCFIQLKDLVVELGFTIRSLQNTECSLGSLGELLFSDGFLSAFVLVVLGIEPRALSMQVNAPPLSYIPLTLGPLLSFINGVT